jgi:phosphoesterase RecJ-like protein
MKLTDYHQIKDVLESAKTVLVMGHVNPDVDSLGSQLALYHAMKKSGKKVTAVCPSPVPKHCLYLPGAKEIKMLPLKEKTFDAVFTVDTPVLERLGKDLAEAGRRAKFLINVDHHISNTKYGTVNLVDEKACASGEIVYELIQSLEIEVDQNIAKCLYAAILTDTNSFRYKNTTALTHEMAAQMIQAGALPEEASKHIYDGFSLPRMRLLYEVLATLEMAFDGKTAFLTVERKFYEKTLAKRQDTEGLIEYARSVDGVLIAVIFDEQEQGKCVKVSFRSNADRYDVNRLAGCFGGGGHAYASGAMIEGKIEDVKKQVLREIGRVLKTNFKGLKLVMKELS